MKARSTAATLWRGSVVAAALTATSTVHAQAGGEASNPDETAAKPGGRGGWIITPHLGVTETFTDNVALSANGMERSDFVTEIKPKIQIRGVGARIKLDFDYELQKFFYARNSSYDRTQNALRGSATVEAVEKFFYVDARASISQQSISPLGLQPASSANFTTDRTETRLFSLSPYIKGGFGNFAAYEVRHTDTKTSNNSNTTIADTHSREWIARLKNRVPLASFGWALDHSNRTIAFGSTEREFESTKATLTYQIDPQIRLFAYTGQEKNDFSVGSQSYSSHGYGFEWNPSPRTQLSGQQDQRFFGKGYNYRFSHRTPLSAWNLAYSRDISTTADQLQMETPSDAYTTYFNSALYMTAFPDPVLRDLAVRHDLAILGLPASTNQALLSNRVSLNRRLNASFALLGARNTLTFAASRSESSALSDIGLIGSDIYSTSTTVRQRSLSATWVYKISALSTLNLNATHTRSEGSAPVVQSSTQRRLNLTLTHKLSPKTFGSLGLRKVQFDSGGGTVSSYDEKAVTGSLSVTF